MTVFREDVAGLLPTLRAFARALTGGDQFLADDLVQDAILRALRAQHQYRPGTNLEAWLLTILRNRFRSLRSRRHVSSEVGMADLEPLAVVPPPQESQLEVIAFRCAFRRLRRAHREMLVLVGVRGLSYEQAAEICGCEVGTAKSRVHRARATLRAMLLDEASDRPPRSALSFARPSRTRALRQPSVAMPWPSGDAAGTSPDV
jgi:RNA polymerase sigma-70 factor (ECF subfamily)